MTILLYQVLTAVSIESNFIVSYNPCNLQFRSIQATWVSQSRWCCIKFIRHVFIKWGIKVCIRKIMHQLVFEYNYEDQCQKENLSKSFNDVTDGGLVLLSFFSHLVMVSSPCNLHTPKKMCSDDKFFEFDPLLIFELFRSMVHANYRIVHWQLHKFINNKSSWLVNESSKSRRKI